ncbi:MlaD family protein [Comamonas resistens]|uniref:MlaD family protein n=1 Tax=Comamonas resistens TaxID=3046670 RepID=A0ABY8SXW6_9BURK|nr:MlaD family protein [Comamonas resistens]MDL5036757.1 MlaD family protein [Comamonas resistens]WHS67885.1 MlaD family protein [Comamonas resistens]
MAEEQLIDDELLDLKPVAHLRAKAAALLALTLLLILGAAGYLLYARGVFEPTQRLVLTADDSEGVAVGMDMTFSGFPIGRVSKIELADDGSVRILVDVPEKDAHWLRQSSVFTLVKGIVGGTTIKAYSGMPGDAQLPADSVRPVLSGDATAELPQIINSAKEVLANVAAMTSSDSALGGSLAEVRKLAERMQGQGGALGVVLGSDEEARKVTQLLERTSSVVNRMDRMVARADSQVFDANGVMPQVKATVEQLNGLLADTRKSMAKVDAVLADLQVVGSNTREASTDLGALRAEVESNLLRLESVLNDLQRKWPFSHKPELKLP